MLRDIWDHSDFTDATVLRDEIRSSDVDLDPPRLSRDRPDHGLGPPHHDGFPAHLDFDPPDLNRDWLDHGLGPPHHDRFPAHLGFDPPDLSRDRPDHGLGPPHRD